MHDNLKTCHDNEQLTVDGGVNYHLFFRRYKFVDQMSLRKLFRFENEILSSPEWKIHAIQSVIHKEDYCVLG